MIKRIVSILLITLTILLLLPFNVLAQDTQSNGYQMGLKEPTEKEIELFEKNSTLINKILPNKESLMRINQSRAKKGLEPLSSALAVADGAEFQASGTKSADVKKYKSIFDSYGEIVKSLPPNIDLSQTNYFPAIGDQGNLGSCASFATTYYAATYQTARKREMNLKANPNRVLSARFSYNLNNDGEDEGSSIFGNLLSLFYLGAPFADEVSMQSYQYNGYDSKPTQYREFPQTAAIYNDALKNQVPDFFLTEDLSASEALELIKMALSNGYVLNFGTDYMYDWQYKETQDDTSTTGDDAFVGQDVCYCLPVSNYNSYSRHAMTIVGYNDDIWVDVNGNGTAESFEKGALKIANSWGSSWKNDGFVWLSYDTIKNFDDCDGAIRENELFIIEAQNEYKPVATAEITLNTARRGQLVIFGGINWSEAGEPNYWFSYYPFEALGGPYSFAGTTSASTATVVIDLSKYMEYLEYLETLEIEDQLNEKAGGKMSLFAGVMDVDNDAYSVRVDNVAFKSKENVAALQTFPQTVNCDLKMFCGKAKINGNDPPPYVSAIETLPLMPLNTDITATSSGPTNKVEWRFTPTVSGLYDFYVNKNYYGLEILNNAKMMLYDDYDFIEDVPLYAGKTYVLRAYYNGTGAGVPFKARINLVEPWPSSAYSAKLSNIKLSTGESLTPAFNSNTYSYKADVGSGVTTLTVTPQNANSYVLIDNKNVLSRQFALSGGAKSARIEVTSPDWLDTKVYNVSMKQLTDAPNVAVSSNYNSAKLSWSKIAGAKGYEIYRSGSLGGTYTRLANITKGTTTSWTNSKLKTGATYYYKMRAVFGSGKYSAYSAVKSVTPALAKVSALKASASAYNSAKLSWSKVTGATGYELHRATSAAGPYKLIKTTASRSFTNKKLDTGTTYYYKVRAYRTVNKQKVYGEFSTVQSAKPMIGKPAKLKIKTSGYNSAKLSWGKVKGASGYNIYRSTSQNGTYVKAGSSAKNTYTDKTLEPYTKYYYKVRAYRSVNGTKVEGADSAVKTASTTLAKPTKTKSSYAAPLGINLKWKSVSGATGYQVYRSASKKGTYAQAGTSSVPNFKDEGLAAGKTYYYKIRAFRTVGATTVFGAFSAIKSAKAPTAVPKSFKAASALPNGIKLSWKAITGASGYEVYRSSSKKGAYSLVGAAGGLNYIDTDPALVPGKTYYYKIRIFVTYGLNKIYGKFTGIKSAKAK